MKKIKIPFKLVLTLIMLAVSLLTVTTLAWLTKSDSSQSSVVISNFLASGDAYFDSGIGRIAAGNGEGMIKVNITTPSAENYIGKLRFDVKIRGISPAYIRVRVLEQWIDDTTDEISAVDVNTPYTVSPAYNLTTGGDQDAWFDNRLNDYTFYYANLYYPPSKGTADDIIPLISGVNASTMEGYYGMSLYISFVVEAVQPNRYEAFWDIDALPWVH